MKDWGEYEVDKERFPYPASVAKRKEPQDAPDQQPLTKQQRKEAEAAIPQQAREWAAEAIKPYNEEARRLAATFWADARETLGCRDSMNDAQWAVLTGKAYDDGHAYGWPETYSKLEDLTCCVEAFVAAGDSGNEKTAKIPAESS